MKQRLLLIFTAGTLLMIFVMLKTGAPLKTSTTPNGIINLELASSLSSVQTILNAWSSTNRDGTNNIDAARLNTWLDFIFIFFYSGFFFLLSRKIGRLGQGFWLNAGNWCAWLAITAAVFDILENTGMMLSLAGNSSENVAAFTSTISALKWGLVLLIVLYCIAGCINTAVKGKIKTLLA